MAKHIYRFRLGSYNESVKEIGYKYDKKNDSYILNLTTNIGAFSKNIVLNNTSKSWEVINPKPIPSKEYVCLVDDKDLIHFYNLKNELLGSNNILGRIMTVSGERIVFKGANQIISISIDEQNIPLSKSVSNRIIRQLDYSIYFTTNDSIPSDINHNHIAKLERVEQLNCSIKKLETEIRDYENALNWINNNLGGLK